MEVLIRKIDNSGGDGAYKKGDIVEVREDGAVYGSMELGPGTNFWVVKIPGIAASQGEKYLDMETEDVDVDGDTGKRIKNRRLWQIPIADIPQGVMDELIATGETTQTWNAIRNFIKNKKTQETE